MCVAGETASKQANSCRLVSSEKLAALPPPLEKCWQEGACRHVNVVLPGSAEASGILLSTEPFGSRLFEAVRLGHLPSK